MKKLLFNFKQRCRLAAKKMGDELVVTQCLSADEISTLNWRRRLDILAAAVKSTFYRDRFRAIGLEPGDVKTEKDWACIPVLTRSDIQDNLEQMVCDEVDRSRLCITTTGGSTGQPLKLYRSKGIPYDAFTSRMLGWWGVDMWENSAYIFRHGYSGFGKVINDLKWWPTKRVFLNAGNMDEEKCAVFYRQLLKIKPKLLVGYVGAISRFAEYMTANKLVFSFEVKAVWTTSAPLPEPLRANLEDVFHAPVYSQYGCCECGALAAECAQKHMHINYDWRHLEIVDDAGHLMTAGESGNILITDLMVKEVPLIRYALGDRGRMLKEQCPCGVNLPIMASVAGRVSEAFPMPDGSRVSGDYLTTIFDKYPDSIRGFRVRQLKDYSIVVEYVKRNDNSLRVAIEDARANLKNLVRGQVSIEFVSVDSIPHDRGKTRYVTTDVTSTRR